MDWASRTEDRGNVGETVGSFFHPSGPSKFGYLIQRKNLILQPNLARGADRMPFHPVNPGFFEVSDINKAHVLDARFRLAFGETVGSCHRGIDLPV